MRDSRLTVLLHSLLFGCVLAVINAVALAMAVSAAAPGTGHYVVKAGAWTHTGVQLKKGEYASIAATGKLYRVTDGPSHGWGPDGYYWLGFQAYDLKAKVGKAITDIGTDGSVTAAAPGELLLGAGYAYEPNPKDAGGIAGQFNVTVTSTAITAESNASGGGPPVGLIGAAVVAGGILLAGGAMVLRSGAPGRLLAPQPATSTPPAGQNQQSHSPPPDPCAAEAARLAVASVQARSLNSALQSLRNLRTSLEDQRQKAAESGFLDATIDLAFIAGPYAGGATFASAGTAIAANAARALGQETLKDFERYALDQGVNVEALLVQGLGVAPVGPDGTPVPGTGGATQQILQNVMKDFLMAKAKAELVASGATVTEAALKSLEENMAGPLSDVLGAMLGGVGMGFGVMDIGRTLQTFDTYIALVRDKTFAAEQAFEEATTELGLARSALNYCHQLHPEAAAGSAS